MERINGCIVFMRPFSCILSPLHHESHPLATHPEKAKPIARWERNSGLSMAETLLANTTLLSFQPCNPKEGLSMRSKKVLLNMSCILFFLLCGMLLTSNPAVALDVDVCKPSGCDYTEIQEAINAVSVAGGGGKVTVEDSSTYGENITMIDGVNVEKGAGAPIIDGGGGTVVTFSGNFSVGCFLDGFHIRNAGSNPGIYIQGTDAGITNSTIIKECSIYLNGGPGIKLDGTIATTAPIVENSHIYLNSEEGIYIIDAGLKSGHAIIQNNDIYTNLLAGISIGGDSYVTIGPNNDIYQNYVGVAFDTGDTGDPESESSVDITGNTIETNAMGGIEIADVVYSKLTITENNIFQNHRGGIGIKNECDIDIIRNNIRLNDRGGINTGADVEGGGGFSGSMGSAMLKIKQNEIYDNGQSGQGGGINVRHASGTIYNNLVYRNKRGGIRIGDHITHIINNTVVWNGSLIEVDPQVWEGRGGGIIFDDLAGAVDDPPTGNPSGPLDIRNNITAYNEKAGIRVCFDNSSLDRDYNLVFDNWQEVGGYLGCSGITWWFRCKRQQFGGCDIEDTETVIWEDPLFVSMEEGTEDYRLQDGSPAIDAGDPDPSYDDAHRPPSEGTERNDLGAYGGPDSIDW